MNKKLKDIIDVFKKVDSDEKNYMIWDEQKIQAFEYDQSVHILAEDEDIIISFYSNCSPEYSANIIKKLYDEGIKDFCICENIYPDFDKEGEYKEMLFGDEADDRYIKEISEQYMSKFFTKKEKGTNKR